jgi:ABC-type nickel/cobalt efflux system permease component RcnA
MKVQCCVLLLLALAPLSAGYCGGDWKCAECDDNNRNQCTRCYDDYHLYHDGDGSSYCHDCGELTKEEEEDYYARIWVGSIIGGVICTITIIVASIPGCCGKMTNGPLIPIAVVIMILAGICMSIPMITGKVVTDSVISDACDKCGCSEQDEKKLKDAFSTLGVLVAYTVGGGFIVVILGGITMCLGCLLCCPCCGPLQQAKLAQKEGAAGAPPAAVLGQVVGNGACAS